MKNQETQINSIPFNKRLVLLVATTLLFLGCEKFVEVDIPNSQLTGATVFNDLATAEAAVTDIYGKLSNNVLVCGNSNGLSILLGSYADELQTYNTQLLEYQFFLNNLISTNAAVTSLWNGSYNLIYMANAIKEGVESSTVLTQDDKERLKGEVLFLRAYIHFHLLNLFGEIPYVTTTDYRINASIGKLSIMEVYELIIKDLEEAQLLIPSKPPVGLKTRPYLGAVKAFLARVHLYKGNWTAAASLATSIIDSGNYTWVETLDHVFLKNSTSTIWQLMPPTEDSPTQEAQSFIFTMGPPPNCALSTSLVNAFELEDLRKEHWMGSVSEEGQTWYYPYKYKQAVPGAESNEYSILFRLAELYLIRAEARVHLGDFVGAKNDLNKIRNRASLEDINATTEQQLIAAILQERRVEFFTELGHRFFDLKRTGRINATLLSTKPGWNETDMLLPIPDSELLLNPNLLPQNPGY